MPATMTAESPLQAPAKMETTVAEIGWSNLESFSSGDDVSGFGSFSDFLALSNGDAPVQVPQSVDQAVGRRVDEPAAVELDAIGQKLEQLSFESGDSLSNGEAVIRDPVHQGTESQPRQQPEAEGVKQTQPEEDESYNEFQIALQQNSYQHNYQAPANDMYPGWRFNYQAGQWETVNDHQVHHVGGGVIEQQASLPADPVKVPQVDQSIIQANQNTFQVTQMTSAVTESYPGWTFNYQTGQWDRDAQANDAGSVTPVQSQSWENMYPGWTYNYQTGQWEEKSSPMQYQFGQQVQYVVQPPATQQDALRSTAGRPSHTITAFGFGGRLVIMKPKDSFEQDSASPAIQLLHLNQLTEFNLGYGSINGPLAGNASMKEVVKWVDDKVSKCLEDPASRSLRYLWGVLKIFCQNYGNLRSSAQDGQEEALAKLLDSKQSQEFHGFNCGGLLPLPSEQQMRATAYEVKRLLILGRQQEALRAAQEGQLWGSALVLAQKLGEKFYSETVALMAQRQFQPGFPLRTLSLLYAGQHNGVFVGADPANVVPSPQGAPGSSMDEDAVKGMLSEWEENLAIMAANPTSGDEWVIMRLGDSLWSYHNEVFGAHLCYLVAGATFEPFAATNRLCLIGADHCKQPRTYASPEAIQRTEIYEFAKVSGNSQFSLLPFQPYKLIYASYLAEAGKVSEALRYCQAVQKAVRTAGHAADDLGKAATLLEERLRIHSQGGQGSSIVHRLFGNIGGLHKMIVPGSSKARDSGDNMNRPMTNASRSSSFLGPSASMEPISDNTGRSNMPVRSVSEPDFRPARNISAPDLKPDSQVESSGSGASNAPNRGGVFTSFVQKAMGLIRTPSKEAKLGEANKFRYDTALGRWVEEGAEAPAEEMTLAPPPMTKFSAPREDENSFASTPERPVVSGIPPMPPSSSHYSARARQNVRSRYVDTFNKGGMSSVTPPKPAETQFLPPAKASSAPPVKFFVPVAQDYSSISGGPSVEESRVSSSNGNVALAPPPPLVQQQELVPVGNGVAHAPWGGGVMMSSSAAAMEAPGSSFYSGHGHGHGVAGGGGGGAASGQKEAELIHTSEKTAFGDDMQDVEL